MCVWGEGDVRVGGRKKNVKRKKNKVFKSRKKIKYKTKKTRARRRSVHEIMGTLYSAEAFGVCVCVCVVPDAAAKELRRCIMYI